MGYTLRNCKLFINNDFKDLDIIIEKGYIKEIGQNLCEGKVYDLNGCIVAPSFIDPHIHAREPGY